MSETAPSSPNTHTSADRRSWFARVLASRRVAFILAASAIVMGSATFGLMTGTSTGTGTPDPVKLQGFLIADLVIILLLALVIVQRIVAMWVQRRQGRAGSALHVRLVVMFSLLAVTPAILVTVFAALFLNFGFNSWFSDRVRTTVEASQAVASAYFEEHVQSIRADVLAMVNDLNRDQALLSANPDLLSRALSSFSTQRNLTEATVISASGQVLARSEFSIPTLGVGKLPPGAIERADRGELLVLTAVDTDQVRALVRLEAYSNAYLLVGRFVDARVLSNMDRVRAAAKTYLSMEESSGKIQITFVAIFAMVSLLLLFAAVWIGMALANQLVRPISRLIEAAEGVSDGDLSQRVDVDTSVDELGILSKAFNAMTSRLSDQQDGMIEMNRKLDERRRFTETVLTGVSAGVIGLDSAGHINLPNRSACLLLDTDLMAARGRHLALVVPEMEAPLTQAMASPEIGVHSEITITPEDGPDRILNISVAAEQVEGNVFGYVVTFDDITELQSAQRKAAWAGMARRIAHEIKNPLTPIQLSAERLKRKYLKQITDDPETFTTCTETIIRQVEDLGRMVDEFSSFSRMPEAVLRPENLSKLCRQSLFLERNRSENITLEDNLPREDITVLCDAQQVSRVLTNILKNASESVLERCENEGPNAKPGWIRLSLTQQNVRRGLRTTIVIEDNGLGLPEVDLVRLMEPYVTTRDKGTGLGLAIVKKIMADHDGDLKLENREEGGARAVLTFPPQDVAQNVASGHGAKIKVKTQGRITSKPANNLSVGQSVGNFMGQDILIVDDEADIRSLVAGLLEDEGYQPREAGSDVETLEMIEMRRPNLVLLDIWLQGSQMDGLQILSAIKKRHPSLPVVMMSGHGTVETAVKALKDGAYDFIEKPFKADRLIFVVERAIEAARLRRENEDLRMRTDTDDNLVGTSSAISQVRQAVERVAPSNSRVLITGPSGCGKEVVARVLHDSSNRQSGPFVVVNCATMEPERLDIELFGTETPGDDGEGGRRVGYFEAAHTGTLLLDDVTEMPLETQGKIVRVLQEQIFERVGGSTKVEVDVRVVASASSDIQEAIKAGRFREDLFYRLSVVPIEVPSLKKRREDIPMLTAHFIGEASRRAGQPARKLAEDAIAALQSYEWPGNVRELKNIIERVLIMAPGGPDEAIKADSLPSELMNGAGGSGSSNPSSEMMGLPLKQAREVFERDYLQTQVIRFGGNISRTAAFVGMERSALHRKLKSLGLSGEELTKKLG